MTLFSMFDKISLFVTENYKENHCMWSWSLIDEERQDMEEEFEDTKGVIRICISKKNRQHNGKIKSTKVQTTIYKTYIKTKDRVTQTPLKTGSELRCSGRVIVMLLQLVWGGKNSI